MVVVGIFAMLMAVVIIGVNPARQIAKTHNAQRIANIANILGGINHYALDLFGGYPTEIDETLRMVGTASSGCDVMCGPNNEAEPPPPTVTSFADDSQTEFDLGAHTNTQWISGSSALGLNATGLVNRTGAFLSKIFDAGSSVTWNSLSWLPRLPYGKEFPSPFTVTESGYPTGNMSMANNVLLMHLNETSGTPTDVSGNTNNGTPTGGVTYGIPAKFSTGFNFNGTNSFMQINHANSINLPNSGGTVMLWIKPTINLPQNTGMGIIRKPDFVGNLTAQGGYSIEIFRNTLGGPQNIKVQLGNGNWNQYQNLVGNTNLVSGSWYHVALNWDASMMRIYLNGVLDGSAARTSNLSWAYGTEKLYIGHQYAAISTGYAWYNGLIDEIALFSRNLTPTEIMDAYKRGALHPKLRVRSCDDASCSGETFLGQDGTANTYFSEEINTGLTPTPLFAPAVTANRYFQYQLILDADTGSFGPEITSVSGGNDGSAGGGGGGDPTTEQTAAACIDLTEKLTPTYIPQLPFDPQTGSVDRTYYAVKKIGLDGITVRACSPELNESIEVKQ